MLKKLILIEDGEKYQFDTLDELVRLIIDKDYYEMPKEERQKKLELKAFANCMQEKIEIVTKLNEEINIDGKFVAVDEISYIYSLLLLNKVMILESTNSNFLTAKLNKSKISENYIIVNHFAKELLNKHLGRE